LSLKSLLITEKYSFYNVSNFKAIKFNTQKVRERSR